MKPYRTHVMLCAGTGCVSNGSMEVKAAFETEVARNGLQDEVLISFTGCNGFCERGPIAVVQPEGIFYQSLKPENVPEIVREHFLKGRPVERFMYVPRPGYPCIPKLSDIDFFKHQVLVAMRNRGRINPESLEDYIAYDGYEALSRVLSGMTPEDVIAEVKKSGLRGRGGAGFPTGLKWELTRRADDPVKYVICNGDEGDPGAFMDRSILEADPFSILEGMSIGAYAIGACEGYVYVRDEYPLAVNRIEKAIDVCRRKGLLGKDILCSGFDFDVHVVRGAGAFVCGEETALIASIEGQDGNPRVRPPYPAQRGLRGHPTNINNVETWANIAPVILHGGGWFASIGTETSKGTKIFSLVGKINNSGLVEIPMGTPLKTIVYGIGGGIRNGRPLKAVQCGGPSGGCIPRALMDLPVDYEKLVEAGAIMGSGGMIVMDDDTCMVDIARYFMNFCAEESCGKCTPCREGTRQMLHILTRICKGEGREDDIQRLERLGRTMQVTALCGLGQTAPNPVLSTIRHFRQEYEAHIRDKRCHAGVCVDLFISPCQNACPVGMDVPAYISLIAQRRFEEAVKIARETNPFLSVCGRVCHHPCMLKCRRNQIDEAVGIRMLKRFLGDYAVKRGLKNGVWISGEKHDERVAVIGSGPAGLSCAYFLARLGYPVTVFEKLSRPGGVLAFGIPPGRLPKDILDAEINLIRSLGVDIKTGVCVGSDLTLAALKKGGYKAVFVAVGMAGDRPVRIPGEDANGVVHGVAFLDQVNRGTFTGAPQKVVVIGGGNTAMDAASAAMRLGASSVTLVYRRSREEMPAFEEEIEIVREEGVSFMYHVAPVEILTGQEGQVTGVKCIRMEPGEYDVNGRRRPIPVEGSEFTLETEMVILAVGEFADVREIFGDMPIEINRDGTIKVRENGATSMDGIFAGGDIATGAATVIEAIAAGERAAVAIDGYLRHSAERIYPWRERKPSPVPFDPKAEPVEYPRVKPMRRSPEIRRRTFEEVELGIDEETAVREAGRCLRCDYREEA